MKELFFGWITKGQYELSFLDSIIAYIEFFILIYLIFFILYGISKLKEKIKENKNDFKKK